MNLGPKDNYRMNCVYGPMTSRRYGSTMGINLLNATGDTAKVCSYNCVYCDLGPTLLTMNKVRKDHEFISLEALSLAFKDYIQTSAVIDAIVVSGNGEPTLYPDFDLAMKLLVDLRAEHLPGKKIVVLTNGAHLDQKKVVAGLNLADERVVKIDAGSDVYLQKINDPLIRLNMAKFLGGFQKLKDLTVQSLFVNGEIDNTTSEHLDEWMEVLGMIRPRAVQLLTLSRPSLTNQNLKALTEDALYGIAFKLKKRTALEAQVFTAPAP